MKKIYLLAVIIACLYSIKVYCHFAWTERSTASMIQIQGNSTNQPGYAIHYASNTEPAKNETTIPLVETKEAIAARVVPPTINKRSLETINSNKRIVSLKDNIKNTPRNRFAHRIQTKDLSRKTIQLHTNLASQTQTTAQCLTEDGNLCPDIPARAGNIALAEIAPLLSFIVIP